MSRGDVPDDVAAIRGELETFLNKKDTDGRIVGNSKYGVYAFYDYDGALAKSSASGEQDEESD